MGVDFLGVGYWRDPDMTTTSTERRTWICPGCSRKFKIPNDREIDLCPDCERSADLEASRVDGTRVSANSQRAEQFSRMLSVLAMVNLVAFSIISVIQLYMMSLAGFDSAAILPSATVIVGCMVSGVVGWICFGSASIGLRILSQTATRH